MRITRKAARNARRSTRTFQAEVNSLRSEREHRFLRKLQDVPRVLLERPGLEIISRNLDLAIFLSVPQIAAKKISSSELFRENATTGEWDLLTHGGVLEVLP